MSDTKEEGEKRAKKNKTGAKEIGKASEVVAAQATKANGEETIETAKASGVVTAQATKAEDVLARLQVPRGSALANRVVRPKGSKPIISKTRRFSRGVCTYGPDCVFLHRLPTLKHQLGGYLDTMYDIFGRTRREAVNIAHTTLFVGGITPGGGSREGGWATAEQQAMQQFGVFGSIDALKGLPSKGVMFIRFKQRVNAEFARDAMNNQTLGSCKPEEVLTVRWAYDDPDPRVVEQKESERMSGRFGRDDFSRRPGGRGATRRGPRHFPSEAKRHKTGIYDFETEGNYVRFIPKTESQPSSSSTSSTLTTGGRAHFRGNYPDTDGQYGKQEEGGASDWLFDEATGQWEPSPWLRVKYRQQSWDWHNGRWVPLEEAAAAAGFAGTEGGPKRGAVDVLGEERGEEPQPMALATTMALQLAAAYGSDSE